MNEYSSANVKKKPGLSGVVIAYNEERDIEKCLRSLQDLCDEIIVVDSYSSDQTQQICNKYKINFIQHHFEGHIEQKNYALSLAQYEWMISLDADEELSPELKNKLVTLKKDKMLQSDCPFDGISFPRLTRYADQWIHHCGWYPDRKLRVVRSDSGQWLGENPHDYLGFKNPHRSQENRILKLKENLYHYSYNSITEHITQTNKFTTISAKTAFKNGGRSSIFKIITRPVFKFIRDFILKKGILDGRYGLIICLINSLSALLKYAKLYDLQRNISIDDKHKPS